jgi:hypothetical protein
MLSYVRQAITTNGGTPASFRIVDAWRELVTAYGGTPTKWTVRDLMREAITAVGGTPTKVTEIDLLRQLLTALGVSPVGYFPRVLYQQLGAAASGPSIALSASSVTENAPEDTVVGTASVINGTAAGPISISAQSNANWFKIVSDVLKVGTASPNYETNASPTVTLTDGVLSRTFTIPVANELEVTLGALALSSLSYSTGSSSSGSITGKTSGSTVTLSGTLPTGLTLDLTAMTWAWDGTGSVSTGSFDLVETHADGSNSPRTSTQSWAITDVVEPTLEIVFVAIEADSTEVGTIVRDAGDTNPANAYNWRTRAPAGISTSLPYDEAVAPTGTSYLAWSEGYVKQNITNSGLPTYVMPHGWNGTRIVDVTAGDSTWGVGRSLHEASITRANTAVAAILAANPGAVPRFTILVSGGTNDNAANADTWETNITAALADFRARVFKNGVSGDAIGTDAPVIFRGMSPEKIGAGGGAALAIEHKMRKFMYSLTNARYWKQPEGQNSGDNVHPSNAGQRADGIGAANIRDTTTAPVITFPSSFSIYTGQKLAREIVTNVPAHYYLTGADAAQFEVHQTKEGIGDTNVNNSRAHWYLRWTGNGDAPAAGTYNVTINAKGNAPTATTLAVTVTVVAAYGSVVETVVASHADAEFPTPGTTTIGGTSRRVIANINLKRGFNFVNIGKSGGTISDVSACVASNGLVGTRDANAVNGAWPFYFYSAQDETVDLYATCTGSPTQFGVTVTSVVGTVAAPSTSQVLGRATRVQQTTSMTCPTNGIIIGGGFCTTGTTEVSGCTQLNTDDGFNFTGSRTTTGIFGISNSGDGVMAAVALAKA